MFFKRKEKKEAPVQEEVVQDVGELLTKAQAAVTELKDKSGEERIAALNEIGILYAEAKQMDEAIQYLEMSLSEKKDLGKGYRTLLNLYNTKLREAAKAKDDEQIQYYLRKIDEMMAISKEVTRASF
ncbi:hypothetical protein MKA37_12020 [[Clostridium] innocuum]|nr:hypothetical protein [[Clostridium] innocuum]